MNVLGIAGYSGSGKTTLIEKVIPFLVREGLRVSLIKHAPTGTVINRSRDNVRERGCSLRPPSFTADAKSYSDGLQATIVLIDGPMLAQLMMDGGIGEIECLFAAGPAPVTTAPAPS